MSRTGWLGKTGGGVFVGLNFALAFTVAGGIILAGYGSTVGAWTAYVLTIPFTLFVLPYRARLRQAAQLH